MTATKCGTVRGTSLGRARVESNPHPWYLIPSYIGRRCEEVSSSDRVNAYDSCYCSVFQSNPLRGWGPFAHVVTGTPLWLTAMQTLPSGISAMDHLDPSYRALAILTAGQGGTFWRKRWWKLVNLPSADLPEDSEEHLNY